MIPSGDKIIIKDLIDNEPLTFKKHAQNLAPEDVFNLLQVFTTKKYIQKLVRLLEADKILPLFESEEDAQLKLLAQRLSIEQLTHFLAMLEKDHRANIYQFLPKEQVAKIEEIITYPADSAGSLMVKNIARCDQNASVRDAVRLLKQNEYDHIQHIFVINENDEYLGTIPSSLLITHNQNEQLVDIMRTDIPAVSVMSNKDDLEVIIKDFYLPVLPVIGQYNELLGLIRTENILKTLQEESSAAIQSMVGVSKDEKVLSSPFFAIKRRLPWLNINLLTAFLAAAVVGVFESTIATYTALAVLLPVIAGQAGNTGAQAQAVMMRGLALREIQPGQFYKVVYKETIAGLVNGLAIGVVTALGVYYWSGSMPLALLIAVSMVIVLILAGVSGVLVPIILKMFNQDPAQSASIILTTVTDCSSFAVFLVLASTFIDLLV